MTRKGQSAVFDYVMTKAWALEPGVLLQLYGVVKRHAEGVKLSDEEVQAVVAGREAAGRSEPKSYELHRGTAVIPISGVIARYARQVNGSSQPRGTSTQTISGQLREALSDNDVKSILLRVDSPGGSVDGVAELADEIFAARGKKDITAVVDGGLCCSAAYFLASQAGRVVASRGSTVGSIGVYAAIADESRAAKNEGVDVTVIRAGKLKGLGVPGSPVTGEHMRELQSLVDSHYDLFTRAVARGRNMALEKVLSVGDGSVHIGEKALELGLIDAVGSFDGVLSGSASANAHAIAANQETNPVEASAVPVAAGEEESVEEPDMDPKTNAPANAELTAAMVAKEHPKIAAELLAEGAKNERERSKAIRALAASGQDEIVEQLIADGKNETEALKALHTDLKSRSSKRLGQLIEDAPKSAGNDDRKIVEADNAAEADEDSDDDPTTLEAQAKAEFKKSATIRAEYANDEKAYIAYRVGTLNMQRYRARGR